MGPPPGPSWASCQRCGFWFARSELTRIQVRRERDGQEFNLRICERCSEALREADRA